MIKSRLLLCLDILYLLLLAGYIFAGMMLATFHGDEAMHIYMSKDFTTAFIEKDPLSLMTEPPYVYDSDRKQRIMNGSVTLYSIGLIAYFMELTIKDLPRAPGWNWALRYQPNVDAGHLPSSKLLVIGRIPSTFYLALSAIVLFLIGKQLTGRFLAYSASLLFVLNPIILLNGRRAMTEGANLCFGLLIILLAIIIAKKQQLKEPILKRWWLAFILVGALALASKHTAVIFIIAALFWIFVADLLSLPWRRLFISSAKLAGCGLAILLLFIIFSPALWNNPPERILNLISTRQQMVASQVQQQAKAGINSAANRLENIFKQPYIAEAIHFEVPHYGANETIIWQIKNYLASPYCGVQWGTGMGYPLTALAIIGLFVLFLPRFRPENLSRLNVYGLLGWLGPTGLVLLFTPLTWQRYYMILIPPTVLLTGIGLIAVSKLLLGLMVRGC
ncbi:MAG: glycosyltransferase family 39 protein [Deltaproteobacteria bacterium]|nr:glycosyltransferase family 39 protein [Deltaproteobacteria bacterium]